MFKLLKLKSKELKKNNLFKDLINKSFYSEYINNKKIYNKKISLLKQRQQKISFFSELVKKFKKKKKKINYLDLNFDLNLKNFYKIKLKNFKRLKRIVFPFLLKNINEEERYDILYKFFKIDLFKVKTFKIQKKKINLSKSINLLNSLKNKNFELIKKKHTLIFSKKFNFNEIFRSFRKNLNKKIIVNNLRVLKKPNNVVKNNFKQRNSRFSLNYVNNKFGKKNKTKILFNIFNENKKNLESFKSLVLFLTTKNLKFLVVKNKTKLLKDSNKRSFKNLSKVTLLNSLQKKKNYLKNNFFFFVKNLKTFSLFFIKTNFLFSYLLKNKIFLNNLIKIFDKNFNFYTFCYYLNFINMNKFLNLKFLTDFNLRKISYLSIFNIFKILYFFSDKNLIKFKYYLFKFCFSKNIFSKKILVKKVNYKIILGNNFNSNFNLKEFCLFFYSWLYYKVFFRKYVYERIIGLYNLWIFFFNYSLNYYILNKFKIIFFNYFFFIICQKFSKLLILLRLRGFELYYHLLKRGENKRLSLGIKPINLVTTFNRRLKKGFLFLR